MMAKPRKVKPLALSTVLVLLTGTACSLEPTTPSARSPRVSRQASGTCRFSDAIQLPGIPAQAGLGPGSDDLGRLAEGPVYSVFQAIPRILDLFPPARDGWRSATILVVSKARYRGPVSVRGHQFHGPSLIWFGPFSRKERELRLPAGSWDERKRPLQVWGRIAHPRPGWRVAISEIHLREGGCFEFQIDGLSFSYPIRFHAEWQD